MTTPDVSVVIPTRDRQELLAATIGCVLRQRDVQVEIVVVDDGSADGTWHYLAGLQDDRIRTLRNESSRGVSRARNRGVAAANGPWIAFLDDDDLWAPDKLVKQVGLCRSSGRSWGFSGAAAIDSELGLLGAGPPPSAAEVCELMPYRNPLPAGASNVVVRRTALDDDPFDPLLRHIADWDLWIRLAQAGEPAVLDEPLVAYRVHEGGASVKLEGLLEEVRIVEDRYADLRDGRPIDRAAVYRWIAWGRLRGRDRIGAVHAYMRAVKEGDLGSIFRAAVGAAYPDITRRRVRSGQQIDRLREGPLAWLFDPALRGYGV